MADDDFPMPAAGADAAHGMAAALIDGEAPPKTVPLHDVDWATYEQDPYDPITDAGWCFWCHHAQSKEQYQENKRVLRLAKFHKENLSRMHPFAFCRKMQGLYNRDMRNNLVDEHNKRIRGPAWSAQSIFEHTLKHAISPYSIREEVVRCMTSAMRSLQNSGIFLDDGTVDTKKLDEYRKTWKELAPLLNKIESMRNTDLYGIE
jgi:hypothetical protein